MSKFLLVFLVVAHLNSIQVQATKTLESGWEHLIRKEIRQDELKCKDKNARLADCNAAKEEDKEEKDKEGAKEEAEGGATEGDRWCSCPGGQVSRPKKDDHGKGRKGECLKDGFEKGKIFKSYKDAECCSGSAKPDCRLNLMADVPTNEPLCFCGEKSEGESDDGHEPGSPKEASMRERGGGKEGDSSSDRSEASEREDKKGREDREKDEGSEPSLDEEFFDEESEDQEDRGDKKDREDHDDTEDNEDKDEGLEDPVDPVDQEDRGDSEERRDRGDRGDKKDRGDDQASEPSLEY